MNAGTRTYTAYSYNDMRSSDKPTDGRLHLVKDAHVVLLTNVPDHGLVNGSLGTISGVRMDCVTAEFDDCECPVEVGEKEWEVLKSSTHDLTSDDGSSAQELVTDMVGSFM